MLNQKVVRISDKNSDNDMEERAQTLHNDKHGSFLVRL